MEIIEQSKESYTQQAMVTIAQSMFEHGNEECALSIIKNLALFEEPEPLSHADATWILHAFSYLQPTDWLDLVYLIEDFWIASVCITLAE